MAGSLILGPNKQNIGRKQIIIFSILWEFSNSQHLLNNKNNKGNKWGWLIQRNKSDHCEYILNC